MPIEIEFPFLDTDPPDQRQALADHFVAVAKTVCAVVFAQALQLGSRQAWQFLALGGGLVVFAYGVKPAEAEYIRTQLASELLLIERPFLRRVPSSGEEPVANTPVVIGWIGPGHVTALPADIARALGTDPDHMTCPSCGRQLTLGMDVKWCPYCRSQLRTYNRENELGVCVACPEDPAGGSVYHHTYAYCPRCGRELQRLTGYHWFDWPGLAERKFMGEGLPLTEFAIDPERVPRQRPDSRA